MIAVCVECYAFEKTEKSIEEFVEVEEKDGREERTRSEDGRNVQMSKTALKRKNNRIKVDTTPKIKGLLFEKEKRELKKGASAANAHSYRPDGTRATNESCSRCRHSRGTKRADNGRFESRSGSDAPTAVGRTCCVRDRVPDRKCAKGST